MDQMSFTPKKKVMDSNHGTDGQFGSRRQFLTVCNFKF